MRKRTRYSLLLMLALVAALIVAVWLRKTAPPEVARLLPLLALRRVWCLLPGCFPLAADPLLVSARVVWLRLPWLALRPRLPAALLRILTRLIPILAIRHRARLPVRDVREAQKRPRLADAPHEALVHRVTVPVPERCDDVTESP